MGNAKKPVSVAGRSYLKRTPSKPGRVDLIPKEFENLIEDQGIFVRITPAVLCPNRDEVQSTNHDLDCPLCNGDEVLELPEKSFKEWAFIQGVTLERRYDNQGLFDFKDLKMTTRANCRVYYMYKVEVLDFPASFNEVIERGKRKGDIPTADKLRYQPVEDSATPTLVVDDTGAQYREGQDFKINFDKKQIEWKTKRPADGSIYSAIYPAFPTFRIIELMHESRWYYTSFKRADKIPVNLPQQSIIRWDYLQTGSGNRVLRQEGGG